MGTLTPSPDSHTTAAAEYEAHNHGCVLV